MLNRSAEKYLTAWFQKTRRKPLVIRGARQVGKSTLVRQFTKNNNLILNEINLEQHLYLDNIFKSLDMDIIIRDTHGNKIRVNNLNHNKKIKYPALNVFV